MLSFLCPILFGSTGAASPASLWVCVGVQQVVWMTLRAARLGCIFGGEGVTTKSVCTGSNSLQVLRVNTATHTAEVIPFEASGRFAREEVVSLDGPAVDCELPVAVLVGVSKVDHAAVSPTRINLAPEGGETLSRGKGRILWQHRILHWFGVTRPDVDASRPLLIVPRGGA